MAGHGGRSPGRSRLPSLKRRLSKATLGLIGAAALGLAPHAAPAAGLSTSLHGMLASPPSSDYTVDTEANGVPLGEFDVSAYATYLQPDPASVESGLRRDGFVAGYGSSWTQQTTGRGLVELVVAFSGGNGARAWLRTAEGLARSSDYFKRRLVVAGIGPYFGAHFANPTAASYADAVSFVKGNDFFTVGLVSSRDDLGDAAAAQAKHQFDAAPQDSIPPAQWPENMRLLTAGVDALKVALAAGLIIGAIGVAAAAGLLTYVRRAHAKLIKDGENQPPDG